MTLVDFRTGEVLDDTLDALVPVEAEIDRECVRVGPYFGFRRELRERIAELRGPAELPRPKFRTDRQQRVSECPRCGHKDAA